MFSLKLKKQKMSEKIVINDKSSDKAIYRDLIPQIKLLLSKEDNILSSLANFTAALKEAFPKISWVGFYLANENGLYLGPFQGKIACTRIPFGKGVCGTAAQIRETIIVPDVNNFAGHIACDDDSKSEIVVPIIKDGEVFGVLDLDSTEFNSFNEIDKIYLEDLVHFLVHSII